MPLDVVEISDLIFLLCKNLLIKIIVTAFVEGSLYELRSRILCFVHGEALQQY